MHPRLVYAIKPLIAHLSELSRHGREGMQCHMKGILAGLSLFQTQVMKQKLDFPQVPTHKKGRLANPPSDYRCESESQDLDIQAGNARHEFNLGRFEVALEAF
ncbi:hypothetical protein VP01_3160g5 [Puccinia sorghi]|uniref:Uncharacterized protein n=1 Tax=Puccinia sorghi TaxID=27349 RepID=A0A0L6UYZ8_9BASI|nr:hypothetical protein VP01_3160g5 [Puccinia sorghi]